MDPLLEIVRETYQWLDGHEFEPNDPENFNRVAGTIDLHAHAGPQRQPVDSLGRHASRAGMRAIVLKDHPRGSSASVASEANDRLSAWSASQPCTATEMIGAVVIKKDSPDDWAQYVAAEVQRGVRVAWLPVWDSANHISQAKGVARDDAATAGLSVLRGDSLSTQAEEVLDFVRSSQVALSFGHASREEMDALSSRCADLGITTAFIDHPFSPISGLKVDDMHRFAGRGVTLNFTYWELSPWCGIHAHKMVETIRSIGIESISLSSDSGFDLTPNSVECMRLHGAMLDVYRFTAAERHQLCFANPARLLGIT